MIKSQFIIMGILSLIAVVGTTSTLSHAYAQASTDLTAAKPGLKAGDILGLADKASSGVSGSDIGGIADKVKPSFSDLQSFADKFASVPSTTDLLNSLSNPTPPATSAPQN